MMQLGGNRRFNEFMKEHGIPQDMPTREKYATRAAKWYRENLKALATDSAPPEALPAGTGHLPAEGPQSSAQHVLDQVFAEAPRGGSMTSGGIPKQLRHSAPAALNRVGRGGFVALKRHHSASSRTRCLAPNFDLEKWLPSVPLPVLLGSSRCMNAERLQTLSSGKMVGFGRDTCTSEPSATASVQAEAALPAPAA